MFLNIWLSVEFLLWWYKSNREGKQVVSQLPFTRSLLAASVCVFGRVSFAVSCPCHMPGRTTRKCKETLLQVSERLKREQANRTSKRTRELLDLRVRDSYSESDSEEEQGSSIDRSSDTLSLLRRDLYLGLLCLLLLIVLQNYWVSGTCLRK